MRLSECLICLGKIPKKDKISSLNARFYIFKPANILKQVILIKQANICFILKRT